MDRAARWTIAVGGVGTIVAVLLVAIFLVWVAAPLVLPARFGGETIAPIGIEAGSIARAGWDDRRQLFWTMADDGAWKVVEAEAPNREVAAGSVAGAGGTVGAVAFDPAGRKFIVGDATGAVRLGTVEFVARLRDATPDEPREVNAVQLAGGARLVGLAGGQVRETKLAVTTSEPTVVAAGTKVVLVDRGDTTAGPIGACLTDDGRLWLLSFREQKNLLTGTTRTVATVRTIATIAKTDEAPRFLRLSGQGDEVVLAWSDGAARRYDARTGAVDRELERWDFTPTDGVALTALVPLVGKDTLVAGDARGAVSGWFRVRTGDDPNVKMTRVHEPPDGTSAVTGIAASGRSRTFVVAHADGSLRACSMTAARELCRTRTSDGTGGAAVLAPQDDAAGVLTPTGLRSFGLSAPHPDFAWSTSLAAVWYEGYPAPAHVWQSTAATDAAEPKLGLWPLVFGTIKATLYAMLFAAPLALLAAIYTSEFLDQGIRRWLKPMIELMASLPSVVLGFLAALVFAPYVERLLPVLATALLAVPATLVLGAGLWQLLPDAVRLRAGGAKFTAICLMLPVAAAVAWAGAPVLEQLLFAGDFRSWLDGARGGPLGGWFLYCLPAAGLAMAWFSTAVVEPRVRSTTRDWSRGAAAGAELAKHAALLAVVFALALTLAATLAGAGLDLRARSSTPMMQQLGWLDTYQQRNATIVGVVMGFAVIPLIYTIAEDALSTVPRHLRSASLGAGATPWQTTARIVIPTAMSGLFSALIIGLGRAVGETMIVLMAAGNTPVMEWNPFNGMRTLSANIAVELPEAVRNSTHYRILFLSALGLFALTFALNTVAELVRQQFRKRAVEL
jgi:phosphate transport system permease protein